METERPTGCAHVGQTAYRKKRGEKMKREKKSFRFSQEALAIIENRDKIKYPTASDFVEQKILESAQEITVENVMEELKELHKEVKQLSGEVAQVKEKTIAEEIVFPPPVL